MALPNVDLSTLGAVIKAAYEGEDDTNALTDALLALLNSAVQADGSISLTQYLDFDPVTAPSHTEGRLYYDSDEKALSYYNEATAVTINIGQEMVLRVRNATGAQIDDGMVVYVSGSTGEVPQITKAIATSHATARIIGVVTHDIANNSFGYATTFGIVRGFNTIGYSAGDVIYLSASTAGEFTAAPPTSPNEIVEVGIVVKVAASGKIFVNSRHQYVHESDVSGTVREYTKQQGFNATTLSDAANISWDLDDNQVASVTLGGDRTLDNPTNMVDGATYILTVKQDGGAPRTLAYGAAYLWEGGIAPTLSVGNNEVDILTFISDGTNMYGTIAQNFS